jgi:hypothetical protein
MRTQKQMFETMTTRLATAEGSIAEGNMSNYKRDAAVDTANALISLACAIDIFTANDRLEWSGRILIARNYATMRQFELMKENIEKERENALKILIASHSLVTPRVDATPSWMQGLPVEMD